MNKLFTTIIGVIFGLLIISGLVYAGYYLIDTFKNNSIEHVHIWDNGVVEREANCMSQGIKIYSCIECGETKKEPFGEKLNHDYITVEILSEPTCEDDGEKVVLCNICRKSETQSISATGHNYEYQGIYTEATCDTVRFDWYKCTTCEKTITEGVAGTAGHTYDAGVIVVPPTCTEMGRKVYTCTTCEKEWTDFIACVAHTPIIPDSIVYSCTDGWSGNVYCSVCNNQFEHKIEPVEHTPIFLDSVEYDCTVDYQTQCSVCHTQYIIPAEEEHNLLFIGETSPTCTINGGHQWKCIDCQKTVIKNESPALGHLYVDGVCARCDDVNFELFTDSANYSSSFVMSDGTEKVGGSFFRLYKATDSITTPNSISFVVSSVWAETNESTSYMDPPSMINISAVPSDLGYSFALGYFEGGYAEIELPHVDYGDYIDFYVPLGTYTWLNSTINARFTFDITEDTIITGFSSYNAESAHILKVNETEEDTSALEKFSNSENYTTAAVSEGMSVANKYFRIYRTSEALTVPYSITLSCKIFVGDSNVSTEKHAVIAGTGGEENENLYFVSDIDIFESCNIPTLYYDDYIDVYLGVGVYTFTSNGTVYRFLIDESTTIESFSADTTNDVLELIPKE